jgi:cytochrome P450
MLTGEVMSKWTDGGGGRACLGEGYVRCVLTACMPSLSVTHNV